ncbi:MAG: YidH family protein, partial [Acidiferrobacteraceae bacterium]
MMNGHFLSTILGYVDGRRRRISTMIKNLRDRLANERTYLASLRTGIAVMAFGFLVERFNIFLSYIGRSLGAAPLQSGQS